MKKVIKVKKSKGATTALQTSFSFDSTTLAKKLLSAASARAREVLIRRFVLGGDSERESLESIGDRTSIPRERVRQIEAGGLDAVRASKAFKDSSGAFEEIARYIHSLGAIVPEETLLSALGKDEKSRTRFRFFLVVDSAFFRERETNDFLARWHVDHTTAKHIHNALSKLYSSLSDEEVVSEGEL